MTIRLMTAADYPACYDLWLRTPGMGLNSIDDSAEGIGRYLKRNPHTCFVAEEEGRIAGVILCGHDGRRGFIHHTAVHPDFRRRGIARMLVDAALAALKREGIHKAALVVFERNETGNAFWQQQGFTTREDLVYRNLALTELHRIDT